MHDRYANLMKRGRRATRAEKAEAIRKALLEGAAYVVGRFGYEGASIARIAQRAKLAQGTFYNYFETRQEVFDLLPPAYAKNMLAYIASRMDRNLTGVDREVARFELFFEFFSENKHGTRIVNEAAVMAPKGYEQYFQIVTEGYRRALRRSMDRGEIAVFTHEELVSLVDVLLAVRTGLANQHFLRDNRSAHLSREIVLTYRKLVEIALFTAPERLGGGAPPMRNNVTARANSGRVSTRST